MPLVCHQSAQSRQLRGLDVRSSECWWALSCSDAPKLKNPLEDAHELENAVSGRDA